MEIMLAYDHSRNARSALDAIKQMFAPLNPSVTLVSVVEDIGSATAGADALFTEQYLDQKAGIDAAAAELMAAGYDARVMLAEGDARKMILRAAEERQPDLLVMTRHSHQADGGALGFITRKLDAIAEEFDHMIFGWSRPSSHGVQNARSSSFPPTFPHPRCGRLNRPRAPENENIQPVPSSGSRNSRAAPTWIAFSITSYFWFNMAPLASSMLAANDWLTRDDIRLFAIANVALTIPARIPVGLALDNFGPRRVFSVLMVVMAIPILFFAFGDTKMQLFVSRLIMSSVGAGFVVGIHMTALWFKPRDIGFAEGFYAGWGNFGSAAAALTIPTIALNVFGGADGWRYAIAMSGLIMAAYSAFYWFAITDGPNSGTHTKAKGSALEVSIYKDLVMLVIFTVPLIGILSILVYAQQSYGFNYCGTVGCNRDEFVVVRKMKKVDWLDREATKVEAAE
ncbi:MFS transporter [uncultured Roseobacter sp.]|uniref:MFS transporter n=1 Tax=uncultured Roseobacter sp. TaxID=114847 RepID=UPI00261918F9|nr:MFS transporter [uncultured Roseobacter sp.]